MSSTYFVHRYLPNQIDLKVCWNLAQSIYVYHLLHLSAGPLL